jgi:hypothetical protein
MPDHPAANRKKRRFPKQVPQWDLLWEFSVFLGLLKQEILHFFNSIKAAIKSRYGILDIKICVVPGNHDIDYLKGDRGASGLANIEDHRSYDKHISEELEKQEQFYILATAIRLIRYTEHLAAPIHQPYRTIFNPLNFNTFSRKILSKKCCFFARFVI